MATKAARLRELAKIRWRDGFLCPKCGGRGYKIKKPLGYECYQCDRRISPTAMTVMHHSRKIPISTWLELGHWLIQHPTFRTVDLKEKLRLKHYETAWRLRKRLLPHVAEAVQIRDYNLKYRRILGF